MPVKDRGFASMSLEARRRISSMGGKAAHAKGIAHTWTPEEAKLAGRKGGQASRRAHRLTPEEGDQTLQQLIATSDSEVEVVNKDIEGEDSSAVNTWEEEGGAHGRSDVGDTGTER